MYGVGVREHIMIAHSFKGEVFGPAQNMHGATFIVDVELRRPELSADNIVVDIGRLTTELKAVLGEVNYQNLDALPQFDTINTTTEFLSRWVFDEMKAAIAAGRLGPGSEGVTAMKVTLWESHAAWAGFEGPI